MAENKVAIITGGASGMGLAVTQALVERGDWTVHVIDVSQPRLDEVEKSSSRIKSHKADVTDYDQLASVLPKVFESSHRRNIDFVFANAGVIESQDFYKTQRTDPLPPPDLRSIDVDLKGLILTCYLAQHYFRRSEHKGKGASLILTASCGGFYPSHYSPMYTAAKHGVVGFGRAIANRFLQDGIRVNSICPGIVETNLTGEGGWAGFPPALFTPASDISKKVLRLVDGGAPLTDDFGTTIPANKLYGLALEINKGRIYYVRGVAPLLKAKEGIYVNCVLPGAVQTPIVPQEMIEAMTPECVTPVETIIKAHDEFIDDERGMAGQTLEGSADQLVYYDMPEPGNVYKTKRATTVWEPLFRAMDGENLDLPDAIL